MTKKENELFLSLMDEVKETKRILYQVESQLNAVRQGKAIELFVDVLVSKGYSKERALINARDAGLFGDANIDKSVIA